MINIDRIQQIVKKKNQKSYKIINIFHAIICSFIETCLVFFKEKDRQSLSLSLNYKKQIKKKKGDKHLVKL